MQYLPNPEMLSSLNTFDWVMIVGSIIAVAVGSWFKYENKILGKRIERMNRLRASRK